MNGAACTGADAGKGRDVTHAGPRPAAARAARPEEDRRAVRRRQCVLKMADGLCSGEPVDEDVTAVTAQPMATSGGEVVGAFCCAGGGGELCALGEPQGFLEDDCRKKRCVDRYDSSESSDRFVGPSAAVSVAAFTLTAEQSKPRVHSISSWPPHRTFAITTYVPVWPVSTTSSSSTSGCCLLRIPGTTSPAGERECSGACVRMLFRCSGPDAAPRHRPR